MDIKGVKELLQKYQTGNCSQPEKDLVEKWYHQLVDTQQWQWTHEEKEIMQKIIKVRIMKQIDTSKQKPVFYLNRRLQWWAAASVIFLFAGFSYFIFFNKSTKKNQVAKVLYNDIKAPQLNKAIIKLANGRVIYLDSTGSGALAIQGSVKLLKLAGGNIVYQPNLGTATTKIEYNTLSNPRGSKVINIILADGSKVWLNTASSLTYPVAFIGHERKVSVTGEAYFEVAHKASMPFIVNNGSIDIMVLGTHFNVNAFKDNGNDIKVTLLEGSVRIKNGSATGLLKPGQQAVVTNDVRVKDKVDLDQVMAWKNGYFQFDNASLQNVLKEVSRWYDVDVVYEGTNQPRQFMGEIQRDLSLSEMLKILEKNHVHFQVKGKQLLVHPD